MSESPGSNIPRTVGRYEVVALLAAGGMAEVLLGRLVGPSGFERAVVIKRILPHLARERSFVDMFVDEARIVSGISHPNVVQVHELGREREELFLVMEYLEGESTGSILRRALTRGESLDPKIGARIVADAAGGLHAAHELTDHDGKLLDVVHRDVSPQNVLVTYDGAVKVLDFGIAKARDRSTVTEVGHVKGKFQYMSPEQCRGEPLDRRSDVFSLGILLFELTTGHRLFKRASDLLVFKAICEESIQSPSDIAEGYPSSLDAICRRALERDREARYPTAAELRKDLLLALRDLGEDAAPDEALRSSMHRLFDERIGDKREMLRRIRAGSTLTPSIVDPEADPGVELPLATRGDATLSTATIPTSPRRSTRAIAGLIAVAAFAAAAGVALFLRAPPATIAAPTETAHTSEPTPPTASAAPMIEIVLHIESSPPGARVLLGGVDRGVSPVDVRVPRGGDKLALVLRRDGFSTLSTELVPDVDQRLLLTLTPARAKKLPGLAPTNDPFHSFDR